jgi:hypothetical protein
VIFSAAYSPTWKRRVETAHRKFEGSGLSQKELVAKPGGGCSLARVFNAGRGPQRHRDRLAKRSGAALSRYLAELFAALG